MSEREVFENIKTATVLRPGDRVLLTTAGRWYADLAEEVQELLRERFPDVEFTLIDGVDGVAVAGHAS